MTDIREFSAGDLVNYSTTGPLGLIIKRSDRVSRWTGPLETTLNFKGEEVTFTMPTGGDCLTQKAWDVLTEDRVIENWLESKICLALH